MLGRGPVGYVDLRQWTLPQRYTSGEALSVADVLATESRWPGFAEAAAQHGIRALHGVPLRLRSDVAGMMALFFGQPGAPGAEDASAVQGLAQLRGVAELVAARQIPSRSSVRAHPRPRCPHLSALRGIHGQADRGTIHRRGD